MLEWGFSNNAFAGNNNDAKLVRIDFVGNLPALLGDYNQNGTVDAADYTVWRDSLGQTGLPMFSGADGSGNGSIGAEDYGVWKSQFGATLVMTGGASIEETNTTAISSATAAMPAESEQIVYAADSWSHHKRPEISSVARSVVQQQEASVSTLLVINTTDRRRVRSPWFDDGDFTHRNGVAAQSSAGGWTKPIDEVFRLLGTPTRPPLKPR